MHASRKFASGKHLDELVHSSLDKVVEYLHKQNEAFDPLDILSLMVYNIIVVMLFGKRYTISYKSLLTVSLFWDTTSYLRS